MHQIVHNRAGDDGQPGKEGTQGGIKIAKDSYNRDVLDLICEKFSPTIERYRYKIYSKITMFFEK